MDVAPEDLQAGGFVFLEKGSAGEANEHGVWQQSLHDSMKLAALGAVALIDKDEQLANGWARLCLELLEESLEVVNTADAKLVD